MKSRKKKALAELEDIEETLYILMIETGHTRCGIEAGLQVVNEQIATIRKGITKRKVKTKRFTIEGIREKWFDKTTGKVKTEPTPDA